MCDIIYREFVVVLYLLFKDILIDDFYFAKKYLCAEYLVEEAVQDVFLKLWEKRTELVRVENSSGWLFQLTRNHSSW
ncbi:MAG: sigma factor [Mangrovibacterium sp.]